MILHFSIVQVYIFFCSLNFFILFLYFHHHHYYYYYLNAAILCLLLLYFDLVVIGRRNLFVFALALILSILIPLFLRSSSVSLSYFIFAVPILECLGKTLVYEFPISYRMLAFDYVCLNEQNLIEYIARLQSCVQCQLVNIYCS